MTRLDLAVDDERTSADRAVPKFVIALGRALEEAAGRLKASPNFAQLQAELSRTEDQLAFARQFYNDACATLNRTMVTIPWSLFVGMSGVVKGEFYDAPDASSAPPQVSF